MSAPLSPFSCSRIAARLSRQAHISVNGNTLDVYCRNGRPLFPLLTILDAYWIIDAEMRGSP
jgi:hypothetical protein